MCVVLGGACGGTEERAAEPPPDRRGETSIEPKTSIAGVRLGASTNDVEALLGTPTTTRPSELHGGWVEWRYRSLRLRVTLDQSRHVWSVRTASRAHRTAGGAGVGLREQQLRNAMAGLRCQPYGGPRRYRHWRVCADTSTYSGPFTSFTLVRGRVRYVTVAQGLAR